MSALSNTVKTYKSQFIMVAIFLVLIGVGIALS